MPRQPGRPRGMSAGSGRDQGQGPPPVPLEWQARFVEMEARMLRAEAELGEVRQQQQQPVQLGVGAPAVVLVTEPQLAMVEDRLEPLYERFCKQHPPIFKGGIDPLEAE